MQITGSSSSLFGVTPLELLDTAFTSDITDEAARKAFEAMKESLTPLRQDVSQRFKSVALDPEVHAPILKAVAGHFSGENGEINYDELCRAIGNCNEGYTFSLDDLKKVLQSAPKSTGVLDIHVIEQLIRLNLYESSKWSWQQQAALVTSFENVKEILGNVSVETEAFWEAVGLEMSGLFQAPHLSAHEYMEYFLTHLVPRMRNRVFPGTDTKLIHSMIQNYALEDKAVVDEVFTNIFKNREFFYTKEAIDLCRRSCENLPTEEDKLRHIRNSRKKVPIQTKVNALVNKLTFKVPEKTALRASPKRALSNVSLVSSDSFPKIQKVRHKPTESSGVTNGALPLMGRFSVESRAHEEIYSRDQKGVLELIGLFKKEQIIPFTTLRDFIFIFKKETYSEEAMRRLWEQSSDTNTYIYDPKQRYSLIRSCLGRITFEPGSSLSEEDWDQFSKELASSGDTLDDLLKNTELK